MSIVHKIGRRKTSVARVYVKPGTGNVTVNGKDAKTYFCTDVLVYKVRAVCEINEEFRAVLKPAGLLTRDARMVERKKPGQKKARKRFQFSKR